MTERLYYRDATPAARHTEHFPRLRAAGAVPAAMLATPEIGKDAVTHTRLCGTTRNNWNLQRTT